MPQSATYVLSIRATHVVSGNTSKPWHMNHNAAARGADYASMRFRSRPSARNRRAVSAALYRISYQPSSE